MYAYNPAYEMINNGFLFSPGISPEQILFANTRFYNLFYRPPKQLC